MNRTAITLFSGTRSSSQHQNQEQQSKTLDDVMVLIDKAYGFKILIIEMEGKNSILVSPLERVIMLVLMVVQVFFFLLANVLLIHYQSIPNPLISYPSMVTATEGESHLLWNASLFLLFWVQHIVMASGKYKLGLLKQWKHFPLYERYIFNISSGLAIWLIFANMKPTNQVVFSLPLQLCFPLSLIGTAMFLNSLRELGYYILMPFPLASVWNSKTITYVPYDQKGQSSLKTDGAYAYSRNPMQAGILLSTVFASNVYSLDRLIFIAIMVVGIVIGVMREEKRMEEQFVNYGKYKEQVKYRFLPYLF